LLLQLVQALHQTFDQLQDLLAPDPSRAIIVLQLANIGTLKYPIAPIHEAPISAQNGQVSPNSLAIWLWFRVAEESVPLWTRLTAATALGDRARAA
jgi:hypothetical protein